jgi:hypothetical protein
LIAAAIALPDSGASGCKTPPESSDLGGWAGGAAGRCFWAWTPVADLLPPPWRGPAGEPPCSSGWRCSYRSPSRASPRRDRPPPPTPAASTRSNCDSAELGPAELEQDIGFGERLCLAAQTAEAAGETPAAAIDWRGLSHIVRHDAQRLARSIESTLRDADRRTRDLGDRFTGVWRADAATVGQLRDGVGQVRGGILRLLSAMHIFRNGFGRLAAHDCHRAEVVMAEASRPIARGLVRIDSGMGMLWLLAG